MLGAVLITQEMCDGSPVVKVFIKSNYEDKLHNRYILRKISDKAKDARFFFSYVGSDV